ncbi:hypothetical protein [Novosphingobium sp. JCM 18896]|uniref:hypothetical protein n=1 Tax=Novosphingobium sp. JCM 18896 TaxID=2989731 RepID=UPI002221CE2D|nr:hypothetical protein [Novosphingobium sp. JCM 18896]MCW1431354.1 hypothetical protein [Novosphingobium sp. JCM 18896]
MTTNEAALKLARSVAEREAPAVLECLFGKAYSGTVERVLTDGLRVAALAAILEVTERALAKLDECREPCSVCHDALSNMEHLS